MARELLGQHNLSDLEVTFSKTKRALGRCFFRAGEPERIDLSSYWLQYLPKEEVKDTILHEIAHAKAGIRAGHGPKWKRVASSIGANPSRVADVPEDLQEKFNKKNANYLAVCDSCNSTHYFNRFTKNWQEKRYRCGKCSGEFTVYKNK